MKTIHRFFFILLAVVYAQACTTKPATPLADDETILDAYWMLLSLEGENVPESRDNRMAYMRLQERENDILGFAGCNKFSGKYKLTETSLQLSDLASTRMSCPYIETENKLMEALRSTTSYRKSGDVLTLYAGNKAVATFRAGNPDQVDTDLRERQ
ncbi:heat shock protein HslJ [Pontibacter aydingkolensis]|uniref:META domain-containing protein n=1 Tax=Pontibacter aydingkolensis TaxID=1911536 RepID=A0ABS7CU70_9BACT|nr:META domain-containing protein [Pontibacter aydingkolensis]MBW7467396.1 META domain-containing protein [Pontibacter aydingkolensis]